MSITWIRHKFESADIATRTQWYMDHFSDFFMPFETGGSTATDASNNGTDVLKVRPYSDANSAHYFTITLQKTKTDSSSARANVYQYAYYNNAGSSQYSQTNVQNSDVNSLYFDITTIGTIKVLRITRAIPDNTNTILLFKESNARDADGGVGAYIGLSGPLKSSVSVADNTKGFMGFLSDKHPGCTFWKKGTSDTGNAQVTDKNVGLCSNIIINRFAACGMITGLYTIDGMDSVSLTPVIDTEFAVAVGGKLYTFYSLGHGLCIRE